MLNITDDLNEKASKCGKIIKYTEAIFCLVEMKMLSKCYLLYVSFTHIMCELNK